MRADHSPGHHRVDTDELQAMVADLDRCGVALEELTDDLDRQVQVLQAHWTGLAADAQALAHGRWTRGLLDLRLALGELRAAGAVAHANYTAAVDANVAMWRSAL